MMKKLTVLLSCLLAVTSVFAKPISEQEALEKARQFMQGLSLPNGSRLAVKGEASAQPYKHLYVFNAEADGGFVVVSGDDRTQSILGYAARGGIDAQTMPCNLRWLLDYYEASIAQLGPDGSANAQGNVATASEIIPPISPLIDTQWGQGDPYNALCPMYEGWRCVTGCVATAMAQVINYHRWPQAQTTGVPSYTTSYHGIVMPELPPRQFDWNNMSNASIAQLMLYCGQTVHMDYDPAASGAMSYDVPMALSNVFGYSKSATLVGRGNYGNDQWNQMVYDELHQGHPVLYFGQSPEAGGHAFIVDGCDDGMYHINWGWEGFCDGYFTLDALNPNLNNGFNYSQEMVVNGCPPADAGDINRPKVIVTNITCNERYLERTSSDTDFPTFTVTTTIESDLSTDATLQIGLALYNDNGLVKVLAQDTHYFTPTDSYTSEAQITIGGDLPQGEYRIVTVNRSSDAEDWLTDLGGTARYVAVSVTETSVQLMPMPKSGDDQYVIEFGVHTINGITYRLCSEYDNLRAIVLLHNETEKYVGDIYIPDYVIYQNMTFNVWNIENLTFENSPELTSLSTPVSVYIFLCPKLVNLELREGITRIGNIINCPSLESITYPSTCNDIGTIELCNNLNSIIIRYSHKMELRQLWDGKLWPKESLPALKDVYFACDVPPSFYGGNSLPQVNENISIHIPQGTIEVYRHSDWKDWNLVEDQPAIPVNVKWDYCGNDEDARCGIACGRGSNDVEFAMRIPTEHITAYKNCQITAIEYYTRTPSINDFRWCDVEYVFVTARGTDYLAKQSVKTIRGTWTRVELSQPYTITGEELFVGIGRNQALEADWANLDIAEDGMWFRVMSTAPVGIAPGETFGEWYKNAGKPDWNHPLPIRAIITGDNLPTDVVIVESGSNEGGNAQQISGQKTTIITSASEEIVETQNGSGNFNYTIDDNGNYYLTQSARPIYQVPQKTTTNNQQMRLKLRNRTPRLVKQVTFDWEIDGNKQEPYTVETAMLTNHEDVVYIDLPNNIAGRNHTVNFNVSEVDGEPDVIQANSNMEVNYSTVSNTYFPRKVVMEEATGTWCGYCPRGMAAIDYMNEFYPNNFIALSIHNSDEMIPTESYSPFHKMIEYYPNSHINRNYWYDPWPDDVDDIMQDQGEAMIKAEAAFTSDGKVEVNTETTFGFSDDGSTEYRIAYVVVEDSVGPYYQSNFYSSPNAADDPNDLMNWWYQQGAYVEVMYNDVARAIYDYDGIAGLLPKNVTEGETYMSKYTLSLPDNIQNAKNLKIVTLLLDTRTGEILNADRTTISGEFDVAVKDIKDDQKVFDIYNLTGMKVCSKATTFNGQPKGVYIINGKKVVVR